MDCGATQATDGACGRCGEGPVLDLTSPLVRDTLAEDDARRELAFRERARYVAVPASIVIVLVACELIPGVAMVLAVALPFFFGYVLAMVGVALVLLALFQWVVPYKKRFPYVEGVGK